MVSYLDLFTPETWAAFLAHSAGITGFRVSQRRTAEAIKPGDQFFCYLVGLGRWVGHLTAESTMFEDSTPYFAEKDDPFPIRVKVTPKVALQPEFGVPIRAIWERLELCAGVNPNVPGWAYKVGVARSLKVLSDRDKATLGAILADQATTKKIYSLSSAERQRVEGKSLVSLESGITVVEIPKEDESEALRAPEAPRRSIRIQALLTQIGVELGFKIWVPANDKMAIQRVLKGKHADQFLVKLPLNADDKTVETVERIDVLWVKGRSIVRAFEVEDTTAVYSGILRMSDLIALQPQFRIKLHLVAPEDRADMVRRQILRPTFAYMEGGPLAKICTYLSYGAIEEVAAKQDLKFMRDEIIEEYEEVME